MNVIFRNLEGWQTRDTSKLVHYVLSSIMTLFIYGTAASIGENFTSLFWTTKKSTLMQFINKAHRASNNERYFYAF